MVLAAGEQALRTRVAGKTASTPTRVSLSTAKPTLHHCDLSSVKREVLELNNTDRCACLLRMTDRASFACFYEASCFIFSSLSSCLALSLMITL